MSDADADATADGTPVVVKIGGARAVDPAGAAADVAALAGGSGGGEDEAADETGDGDGAGDGGTDVVVVHGGSTAVDDLLSRLGIEPEYVETPAGVTGRFTDEETMEAFTMAMSRVNTDLVATLREAGADALGLSGVDGGLLTGARKSAVRVIEDGKRKIRRGDHSGTIDRVNADLLETLLADGYTPVVGPPMLADDGVPVNTDADRAAAAVAGALGARLVLLTDVAGVYTDPADPDTRIDRVTSPGGFDDLADAAEGFMGRKVMAVREALEGGAAAAVVASANADAPVRAALGGDGTTVTRAAVSADADDGVEADGGAR
ncbi:MAG: acetylglutamate/acetylaminoadipate kinase [Haloferacaceae archaeon]